MYLKMLKMKQLHREQRFHQVWLKFYPWLLWQRFIYWRGYSYFFRKFFMALKERARRIEKKFLMHFLDALIISTFSWGQKTYAYCEKFPFFFKCAHFGKWRISHFRDISSLFFVCNFVVNLEKKWSLLNGCCAFNPYCV